MQYEKKIFLLKNYASNEIFATILVQYNFDEIFVDVYRTSVCEDFTHLFMFNSKEGGFFLLDTDSLRFKSHFFPCHFALLKIDNNTHQIVCSDIDIRFVVNFYELLGDALEVFLNNQKVVSQEEKETLFNDNEKEKLLFEGEQNQENICEQKNMICDFEIGCFETEESKNTYFERNKESFNKLLSLGQDETLLNDMFGNSKWRRIFVKNRFYVFGVIYNKNSATPKFIGVGIPVVSKGLGEEKIKLCTQFFPAKNDDPDGFGFYLGFKDANTGKNVNFGL